MVTSVVLESVGWVVALGALSAPGAAGAANAAGAPDAVPVSSCKPEKKQKDKAMKAGRDEGNHRTHQQCGSASGCKKQQMLSVGSQQAGRTGPTSLRGQRAEGLGGVTTGVTTGVTAGCRFLVSKLCCGRAGGHH